MRCDTALTHPVSPHIVHRVNNSSVETNVPSDQLAALLDELDGALFRMGRLMMSRQGDFVHENGLTAPQFMVLKMLLSDEHMRVSDIAVALGVKNPAASMVLQGLQDHGWVTRTQDADDHRVVRVSVTAEGAQQIGRCEDSRREFMRRFTADLSFEDLESFVRILTTLADTVARIV